MTVAELITALQMLPPDLEVFAADRSCYTKARRPRVGLVLAEPRRERGVDRTYSYGIEGEQGAFPAVII